jgi:N-acetylmuramoyl-L-alanine amidase
MRKAIWIIVCTLSFSIPSFAENEALIAVDVGHSFDNSGASSARGVSEFEYNSILAAKIAKALYSSHTKTVLIGADGTMSDIHNRTAKASSVNAKFFLSVHHDSAKPQFFKYWKWNGAVHHYADKFSGYSLFVSRKNPYLAESLKCATTIGSKLQESGFHHSTYHADAIAGESREWADQLNGVYYFDDLIVLKTATQPAVLLEAGVIVNRKEEESLKLNVTQEKIAEAVKTGLSNCGVIY